MSGGGPRRVAVAVLAPPLWGPPGIDPARWRQALIDDILDMFATMAEVEPAVAVVYPDEALLRQVGWPGLRAYVLPGLDVVSVFGAAADDGFEQAVLLAGDAPDLPGMTVATLLRPLASRPVATAPVVGGGSEVGLLGLSANLPAAGWLPAAGLDALTPQSLRRLAPRVTDVAPAPGWHRMRSAGDLVRLDPRRPGWEATRAVLSGGGWPGPGSGRGEEADKAGPGPSEPARPV